MAGAAEESDLGLLTGKSGIDHEHSVSEAAAGRSRGGGSVRFRLTGIAVCLASLTLLAFLALGLRRREGAPLTTMALRGAGAGGAGGAGGGAAFGEGEGSVLMLDALPSAATRPRQVSVSLDFLAPEDRKALGADAVKALEGSRGVKALFSEAAAQSRFSAAARKAAATLRASMKRELLLAQGLREKLNQSKALAESLAKKAAAQLEKEAQGEIKAGKAFNKTAALQKSAAARLFEQANESIKTANDTLQSAGGIGGIKSIVQAQFDVAEKTKRKAAAMIDSAEALMAKSRKVVAQAQNNLATADLLQKVGHAENQSAKALGTHADAVDALTKNITKQVKDLLEKAEVYDEKALKSSKAAKAALKALVKGEKDFARARAETKAAQVQLSHAKAAIASADADNKTSRIELAAAKAVLKELRIQNRSIREALNMTESMRVPSGGAKAATNKVLQGATAIVGMSQQELASLEDEKETIADEQEGATLLAKQAKAAKAQAKKDIKAAEARRDAAGRRFNAATLVKRGINSQGGRAGKNEIRAMRGIARVKKAISEAIEAEMQARESAVKALRKESGAKYVEVAFLRGHAANATKMGAELLDGMAEQVEKMAKEMHEQIATFEEDKDIPADEAAQKAPKAASAHEEQLRA